MVHEDAPNGGTYLIHISQPESSKNGCTPNVPFFSDTESRLKRIYILFNGKHLLNAVDLEMLANLSGTLFSKEGTQTYTLQAIITKVDCIPSQSLDQVIPKIQKQIWEAAPLCLSPIITSAMMRPMFGVDAVRRDIAEAAGLVLKK
jgi:GTP-binding protein